MTRCLQLGGSFMLCFALLVILGDAQTTPDAEVPGEHFQGVWDVKKHFVRDLPEGAADFEALGYESPKGEFRSKLEIRFRRHPSGPIQQVWSDRSGGVIRSKGITVLWVRPRILTYRVWSDHPTWKRILTINEDGSAMFQVRSLKHQETFLLGKRSTSDDALEAQENQSP